MTLDSRPSCFQCATLKNRWEWPGDKVTGTSMFTEANTQQVYIDCYEIFITSLFCHNFSPPDVEYCTPNTFMQAANPLSTELPYLRQNYVAFFMWNYSVHHFFRAELVFFLLLLLLIGTQYSTRVMLNIEDANLHFATSIKTIRANLCVDQSTVRRTLRLFNSTGTVDKKAYSSPSRKKMLITDHLC